MDRSVSEISVLPQHFIMGNLLIGLSFPEFARTRAQLLKCDVKNLMEEPLTSLPPLTCLRRTRSAVVSFSLAVLRVGRRHCSAGSPPRQFRRGGQTKELLSVTAVRNAVGPSISRSMCDVSTAAAGHSWRRLPIEAACPQAAITRSPLWFSLTAVFRACAFQILIDGRFAVLSGKRGFHVHGLPSAFDAP